PDATHSLGSSHRIEFLRVTAHLASETDNSAVYCYADVGRIDTGFVLEFLFYVTPKLGIIFRHKIGSYNVGVLVCLCGSARALRPPINTHSAVALRFGSNSRDLGG